MQRDSGFYAGDIFLCCVINFYALDIPPVPVGAVCMQSLSRGHGVGICAGVRSVIAKDPLC